MSDVLEGLSVILTTIWWSQNLGRSCQQVNMQHIYFQILYLKKPNDAEIKKAFQTGLQAWKIWMVI
jgi:hypothetical protein